MNEEVIKLNKRLDEQQKEIADLKAVLSVSTMPFELREIIRNEVTKGEDSLTAFTRTQEISVDELPITLTLPVNPIGIVVIQWKGKEYKLPYIQ